MYTHTYIYIYCTHLSVCHIYVRYICIYVFYLYVCLIYMCTLGKAVGSLIWGCMGQQGKQEPARRVFQKPATRAARFAGFGDAGRPAPAKPAAAASAPAARRRPPPPPAPPREPRRRPLGACRFGGFGWGGFHSEGARKWALVILHCPI